MDFQGNEIGRYWTVGGYQRWAWYGRYTMRCINATIAADPGRTWYGRFNDEWHLVHLRRHAA
jgi:hypothetical protein